MWAKHVLIAASLGVVAGFGLVGCERQTGQTGQETEQDQQQQQQDQQQQGETYGTDVPADQQEDTATDTDQSQQQADEPTAPGQAADQQLQTMAEQIQTELEATSALQGQLNQVEVTIEDQMVVLTGNVSSQTVADQIEQTASDIAGTEKVRNELSVGEDQSP